MGPAATCDLMEKIVALTKASTDQEHLHVLIDNNTQIPDRTAAIFHEGPDPTPEICTSARRLVAAGAEILLLSCNTAHYFYDRIAAAISVPVLHMPREVAKELCACGVKRAGVLATDGTIRGGVYEAALAEAGIQAVYPSQEMQRQVMRIIYDGVKGRSVPMKDLPLGDILRELQHKGAEMYVLACTELPIAFEATGLMEGCLDATRTLAIAAIKAAGAETVLSSPF